MIGLRNPAGSLTKQRRIICFNPIKEELTKHEFLTFDFLATHHPFSSHFTLMLSVFGFNLLRAARLVSHFNTSGCLMKYTELQVLLMKPS